jgi:predicted DNA-binding transcriptional regulator YafY
MPDESNSEEEIRLKFSPRRFKYVTSKPLHKLQTIISEEECVVSLRLYYTKELEQQLFSYGPDVEVLSPQWIRESFSNKIAECMKKYFSVQNDCIEGV